MLTQTCPAPIPLNRYPLLFSNLRHSFTPFLSSPCHVVFVDFRAFSTWDQFPLHRSIRFPLNGCPDGSSRRSLLTASSSPHSLFAFFGVVSDSSPPSRSFTLDRAHPFGLFWVFFVVCLIGCHRDLGYLQLSKPYGNWRYITPRLCWKHTSCYI
jgi:hypothetical protein